MLICNAIQSNEGYESTFMKLREHMDKLGYNPDPNVVAAERFFKGLEENPEAWVISLGFQYVGKNFRESALADILRYHLNKYDGMLLGKNGTPANTAGFTTKWGYIGAWHNRFNIKVGSTLSPISCENVGMYHIYPETLKKK